MARTGIANPRRRSAMTRANLLEAAAEIFDERGYEGTTLAAVARRASVTTGAIYSNFHGKEDLLYEVLRARLIRQDEVREALLANPEVSHLRITLDTESTQPDRPRMHALLLEGFAAARRSPVVQDMMRDLMAEISTFMAERVRLAQQEGLIAGDIDPMTLAWFYLMPTAGRAFIEAIGMSMPQPETWSPILERVDQALKGEASIQG